MNQLLIAHGSISHHTSSNTLDPGWYDAVSLDNLILYPGSLP